jgi:hypothetical protein
MGSTPSIKADNGRPIGDPGLEVIPVLSLWLIGLGIPVCLNRPKMPQDNAKVERSQRTLANWTEYRKCKNVSDLQKKLTQETSFYNFHFPIRRWKNQKRIERFPNLKHTGQKWEEVTFELNRVLIFLSKGYWMRKVSSFGQISLYGVRYQVSSKYKGTLVSINLCSSTNQWNIFNSKGELISQLDTPFSIDNILNLDLS